MKRGGTKKGTRKSGSCRRKCRYEADKKVRSCGGDPGVKGRKKAFTGGLTRKIKQKLLEIGEPGGRGNSERGQRGGKSTVDFQE